LILFKFTYNYNQFNLGVHCKAFRNPVAYNAVEASPPIANHKLQEEEKHPAHNSLINPIHYSILHLVWKEQHSFHTPSSPMQRSFSSYDHNWQALAESTQSQKLYVFCGTCTPNVMDSLLKVQPTGSISSLYTGSISRIRACS
jgi:hypothetical protein